MSIRNFILGRISKLDDSGSSNPNRRVPLYRTNTNSKWKPLHEVIIENNILEGAHKIKIIPYEQPSCRKHQGL